MTCTHVSSLHASSGSISNWIARPASMQPDSSVSHVSSPSLLHLMRRTFQAGASPVFHNSILNLNRVGSSNCGSTRLAVPTMSHSTVLRSKNRRMNAVAKDTTIDTAALMKMFTNPNPATSFPAKELTKMPRIAVRGSERNVQCPNW